MTAKNRTSSKLRKPGVYVDQAALQKDSNTAFQQSQKAKKFAELRKKGRNAGVAKVNMPAVQKTVAPAVVKEAVTGKKRKSRGDDGEESKEGEDEEEGDGGDNDADDIAAAASSATTVRGLDGFTLTTPPHTIADSSTLLSNTISKVKDDKLLGVALYEWLLTKLTWDCHTLWEKFLVDWDLISEVERPPGTNRPINLHSYLTYLKSVSNKYCVRKDIKEVREQLMKEREHAMIPGATEEDPQTAKQNYFTLNTGSLLSYYLKIKNLIPYENEKQKKKREEKEMRNSKAQEEKESSEKMEDTEVATEEKKENNEAPAADEFTDAKQPKKKKAKFVASSKPVAAAPLSRPTSTLKLGQPSSFAALLDCD